MMSKGKELWRAIKLFLLYRVIATVIIGFAGIPIVFHGLMMHMSREAIEERVLQSNYYKLSYCIACLLIIILFINNRYVKMSLERMGRIARMKRTTLWTSIGIAAMISVGCFFSSLSFSSLKHISTVLSFGGRRRIVYHVRETEVSCTRQGFVRKTSKTPGGPRLSRPRINGCCSAWPS